MKAWPGVPDRSEYRGYFRNQVDYYGDDVISGGIPSTVNTTEEFISWMKARLGGSTQSRVGASFMIQTMIGLSRNLPPTAAQIAEWEARVRYASSQGWIQWNVRISYSVNSYYQDSVSGGDDAFYYDTGTDYAIVFRNASGGRYSIRRACANPVGNLSVLENNPSYNIVGRTTVSDATVTPGQSVTFRHYIRNEGPSAAYGVLWETLVHPSNARLANGGPTSLADDQEKYVNGETFTVPIGTPVGTQYCRKVAFTPASSSNSSREIAAPACTTVIADFTVTPQVQADAVSAQEGDTVNFTYTVYNNGPTETNPTTCKVVGNERPPGYTPLPQQDTDRNSDAGYVPPGNSCPQVFQPRITTQVATEAVVVGNQAPGTRLCRSLVINPKDAGGGFRASAEVCVVIAKTPYAHFMGGDVWAGGDFSLYSLACDNNAKIQTTARQLSDGSIAGSVSEYGAFALDKITKFGSASKALNDPSDFAAKQLTFANSEPDPSLLGYFGAPQHCINDYLGRYTQVGLTGMPASIDVGGQPSGVRRIEGDHTFRGTMPNGSTQVYIVENGTVTIDADLRYSNSYNGTGEIPSLVILSVRRGASDPGGDIRVLSGVQQMDGLFMAHNTFLTCYPKTEPASVSICNTPLQINGAVVARNLDLFRTAGASGATPADRKQPAETFNFTSEMYLRSALNTTSQPTITTMEVHELPPRF
ncbi:MAG: hypothetical protein ACREGJ_04755 [Candidatus Saccharimonadales bacterium]